MASDTVLSADTTMGISESSTNSLPLIMSTQDFANSTQPIPTTTITVSDEPETETSITTIWRTSFTTHTITTTVPGIPGVLYTIISSVFPNISHASVPEEYMTATGARLSQLLSLTDSDGKIPSPPETNSTDSSSEHTTEIDPDSAATASSGSSTSSDSESLASGPLASSPATVSAIATESETPVSASSLAFTSSSLPSLSSTGVPARSTPLIFPSITSTTAPSSSWITSTRPESVSTEVSNTVIPFSNIDPAHSSDCPSTVDCATWSPDQEEESTPTSTSDPFEFKTISVEPISARVGRYSLHKRDTSWSALDARGYGLLVVWFFVGTIAGIALVLIVLRFWAWRTRRKLFSKRTWPSGRSDYAWIERGSNGRRGSTSPTHVSGTDSVGHDSLVDTRLLRRSWQEDSVV